MAGLMDETRLEARLRANPTGDPMYRTGSFRDRVVAAATIGVRARHGVRNPSFAGLALALAVVLLVSVIYRGGVGPNPSPSPSPSATPSATFGSTRLLDVVMAWAAANGSPDVNVSVASARGELWEAQSPGPAEPRLLVRLGETSRVFVVGGAVALDECAKGLGSTPCPATPAGVFSLDDRVSGWVPDWPTNDPTTVRQLLDGRSGLAPVGPTIADLRGRVLADPTADWSRATLLSVAINAPRRFAPGAERSPVDSEFMLLEDVIARVANEPASLQIDRTTSHGHGTLGQTTGEPPVLLTRPGFLGSNRPLADLEPAVVAIEGDQGAIVAGSTGLAYLAIDTWGDTVVHDDAAVQLMGDTANGFANPFGASGTCPCQGAARALIVATGHSTAWSSLTAYDVRDRASIGIVLDHDLPDAVLRDLLQRIVDRIGVPS